MKLPRAGGHEARYEGTSHRTIYECASGLFGHSAVIIGVSTSLAHDGMPFACMGVPQVLSSNSALVAISTPFSIFHDKQSIPFTRRPRTLGNLGILNLKPLFSAIFFPRISF